MFLFPFLVWGSLYIVAANAPQRSLREGMMVLLLMFLIIFVGPIYLIIFLVHVVRSQEEYFHLKEWDATSICYHCGESFKISDSSHVRHSST